MEQTLIILKPDAMENHLCGTVIARFEKAGFEIHGAKMMRLTPALLREHYAHVADKPFYPEIEAFMSSRPVVVLILAGEREWAVAAVVVDRSGHPRHYRVS